MKVFLFITALSLITSISKAQDTITLTFAGDIMGHDAQIESAWDSTTKAYNYAPTFRYVKPYIESVDVAIANLEVTLAGPPYKGYPQFSSPDTLAIEAKKAGFDVLVTANNHCLDRGVKGFERTLKTIDSLGFKYTGTFVSDSAKALHHPLYIEIKNKKIALLNYTYGTNGLRVPDPYLVSRINWENIKKEIEMAKADSADFIIVATHWGTEYQLIENEKQQKLAAYIFTCGADAIIGSHPHVVQPIRHSFRESDSSIFQPVAYSVGNYVSNQRARYKDGGIMVELQLVFSEDGAKISELRYLPTWVYKEVKEGKTTFQILPVSHYENNKDSFNLTKDNLYRIERFSGDTRKQLQNIEEIKLDY